VISTKYKATLNLLHSSFSADITYQATMKWAKDSEEWTHARMPPSSGPYELSRKKA
jgi:hypothetical protein